MSAMQVWSDISVENLNLLRHFHLTNQGLFGDGLSCRSDAERAAEGVSDDRHGEEWSVRSRIGGFAGHLAVAARSQRFRRSPAHLVPSSPLRGTSVSTI